MHGKSPIHTMLRAFDVYDMNSAVIFELKLNIKNISDKANTPFQIKYAKRKLTL